MRDRDGKLAYRAVSYTPWPVEEGSAGKQLRIDVGPVNRQEKATYVFDRCLHNGGTVLLPCLVEFLLPEACPFRTPAAAPLDQEACPLGTRRPACIGLIDRPKLKKICNICLLNDNLNTGEGWSSPTLHITW
jgi:hypothetical protein